ncbi:MAG: FUSC family protein [Mycobacterium sp.]|nr:FUSC family protein [Mycobacterium sp.]
MVTLPGFVTRTADRIRTRDPENDAARRALRAAIVIPVAAALSFAIAGPTQTPVFTLVGSIALLIVANFPGTTGNRALGYLGLAVNGAILITLGTVAAPHVWVAVPLCFVVGALVSILGLLSEIIAASQRATLMTFVLPICIVPTGPVSDRLLGWVLALTVCVPAALFLFPPRYNKELRNHAGRVCTVLADLLDGNGDPDTLGAELTAAMDCLRAGFRKSPFRPVALTAGSRALIRVVSNLQWLSDRVGPDTRELLGPVAPACVQVLRRSADVLNHTDDAVAGAGLATAVDEYRATALQHYDQNIAAILTEPDDDIAVDMGRALLTRRAMSATIGLTGRIIASAAAADSRPMWARLLGRQLPETMITDRVHSKRAAVASLGGYMSTRSITVLNSLRTGFALALAVLVTELLPVQNGPWIVLGALSVMRSSVLSTGTTAVRALTGTAIGIAVGALVMILLGVDQPVLWALLPVVAFGSTYVSAVGSFTASQAMFTMMVLIVFNLMHPTGWQVGLVRIEDILIGALVGLVVTALLWPGGAQAAVQRALRETQIISSLYLEAAMLRVTRGASETIDVAIVDLSDETLIASRTYADAVRVYLSENGGAIDSEMLDTNNRIPRLRFAADLIADIVPPPTDAFPLARMVLEAHTIAVCARLEGAEGSSGGMGIVLPIGDDFVRALRAEAAGLAEPTVAALPLVLAAANVGELELSYPATPAGVLA